MKKPALISLAIVVLFILMLSIGAVSVVKAQSGETKTISLKSSTVINHNCNAEQWQINITGIASKELAPENIQVKLSTEGWKTWGRSEYNGKTAQYKKKASSVSGFIEDATAVIYKEWNGQFVISHGPCNNPTPTPTDPTPSTSTPTNTKTSTYTPTPTSGTPTPTEPTPTGPTPTPTDPTPTTVTPSPTGTLKTPTHKTPTPTEPSPGGKLPANPATPLFLGGFLLLGMLIVVWNGVRKLRRN